MPCTPRIPSVHLPSAIHAVCMYDIVVWYDTVGLARTTFGATLVSTLGLTNGWVCGCGVYLCDLNLIYSSTRPCGPKRAGPRRAGALLGRWRSRFRNTRLAPPPHPSSTELTTACTGHSLTCMICVSCGLRLDQASPLYPP